MAEAFLSVHDMIHAAIRGRGGAASLRQIYTASQARGRIIYKRAGGSRLITNNEHWKSQIRHALYTSGRFKRVAGSADEWEMAEGFGASAPSTAFIEVFPGEEAGRRPQAAAGTAAARKKAEGVGGTKREGTSSKRRAGTSPSAAAAVSTAAAMADDPGAPRCASSAPADGDGRESAEDAEERGSPALREKSEKKSRTSR